MGDRLGILSAVGFYFFNMNHCILTYLTSIKDCYIRKSFAPGEARTHGLQIMRLTRCLLRYGGSVMSNKQEIRIFSSSTVSPNCISSNEEIKWF